MNKDRRENGTRGTVVERLARRLGLMHGAGAEEVEEAVIWLQREVEHLRQEAMVPYLLQLKERS